MDYADAVTHGRRVAGKELVLACFRFQADLNRPELELHTREPDFVIGIIQRTMVHMKGEDLQGNSLVGTPFRLDDWEIFIVYNLLGFYWRGTNERRYRCRRGDRRGGHRADGLHLRRDALRQLCRLPLPQAGRQRIFHAPAPALDAQSAAPSSERGSLCSMIPAF